MDLRPHVGLQPYLQQFLQQLFEGVKFGFGRHTACNSCSGLALSCISAVTNRRKDLNYCFIQEWLVLGVWIPRFRLGLFKLSFYGNLVLGFPFMVDFLDFLSMRSFVLVLSFSVYRSRSFIPFSGAFLPCNSLPHRGRFSSF